MRVVLVLVLGFSSVVFASNWNFFGSKTYPFNEGEIWHFNASKKKKSFKAEVIRANEKSAILETQYKKSRFAITIEYKDKNASVVNVYVPGERVSKFKLQKDGSYVPQTRYQASMFVLSKKEISGLHMLKFSEHLTLKRGSTLFFPVPKYWEPKAIKRKADLLKFDITGCDKINGYCSGIVDTANFIFSHDDYYISAKIGFSFDSGSSVFRKNYDMKTNIKEMELLLESQFSETKLKQTWLELQVYIKDFKRNKEYTNNGRYYAVPNVLIQKTKLKLTKQLSTDTDIVINRLKKTFIFKQGYGSMPDSVYFNVDEQKLREAMHRHKQKKRHNNPPYFIKGTNCVDPNDARNGKWLSEMWRRGGILDNKGCLLKSKGKFIKQQVHKSYSMTDNEKRSLLKQIVSQPSNKNNLSYGKHAIKAFLQKGKSANTSWDCYRKNRCHIVYTHTCKQTHTNTFKCKFHSLERYKDSDGDTESSQTIEYDAIRRNGKVFVQKIYPIFIAG